MTTANDDELTAYRRNHVGFVFQFYTLIPSLVLTIPVSSLFRTRDDWTVLVDEGWNSEP